MQLVCPIPTIHFKPVENKKKTQKGKRVITNIPDTQHFDADHFLSTPEEISNKVTDSHIGAVLIGYL